MLAAKEQLDRRAAERQAHYDKRQAESDARARAEGRPSRPLKPNPYTETPQPDAEANFEQLAPMVEAIRTTVSAAGIDPSTVRELVADRGYWRADNVNGSIPDTPELFIKVARYGRTGQPLRRRRSQVSGDKTRHLREAMEAKLATDRGRGLMRMRAPTIEGLFGHIKQNRGIRRFSRRGLSACNSEWKLVCATHNLFKLWLYQTAAS